MVLVEFDRGRQEVIEKVDSYLKETFQVDSYLKIAPVVLLQKSPDEHNIGVYPLTSVEPKDTTHTQAAYALVNRNEPPRIVRSFRGRLRLEKHFCSNKERSIKRPLSLSLGDGIFVRRVREFKKLIGRPIHFLGVVEDHYSNEQREVYVIDFAPSGSDLPIYRFMASKWIMENTAQQRSFWPGHKRPISQIIHPRPHGSGIGDG